MTTIGFLETRLYHCDTNCNATPHTVTNYTTSATTLMSHWYNSYPSQVRAHSHLAFVFALKQVASEVTKHKLVQNAVADPGFPVGGACTCWGGAWTSNTGAFQ